jgi:hypothetical protein
MKHFSSNIWGDSESQGRFAMITLLIITSVTLFVNFIVGIQYICRYSPVPKVLDPDFDKVFIYTAGAIHIFFAVLVLIGYFMANNPQISSIQLLLRSIR